MDILVRKYTARHIFHPHFNRSMGRYYGTEKEYYSDLKSKGLEPFDGNYKQASDRKPYRPSNKARELYYAIKQAKHSDGKFYVGDRFKEALMDLSKGKPVVQSQVDIDKLPAHYQKGGF